MRHLLVLLVTGIALLTACGPEEPSSSIPESEPFNQTDVDFATDMILHHSQALTMVDMAAPREGLPPRMTALLEEIRTAQTQEAEQLTDWLEDWGQPVPNNPRSHGGADHDAMTDTDMPGMMSEDRMAELEGADGDAFVQTWLTMMIEHHEGAIEMADAEVTGGEFPGTVDLAEQVATNQADEIDRMETLLD